MIWGSAFKFEMVQGLAGLRRVVARTSLAVTLATCLCISLNSSPASAQGTPPTKLDFAGSVTWIGMVPIMIAVEKGFYKEVGLDVTYRVVLNSSDRIRALTAGDVAFSNVGSVAAISELSRGNNSFYITGNVDDSPGNEGCWARPAFKSMADLKGKTVASNASAEITMHGVLAANGMSVKDIKFVSLSPNEFAGALSKGDIDAACVWEPLLTGLKKAVPEGHLVGMDTDTATFKKYGTMSAPDILIMSKTLIDQHPAQAAKLMIATFKGADYATTNPEDTATVLAPIFRRERDDVLAGIKGFKFFGRKGWAEHMKLYSGQLQELSSWLSENKKIDRAPDIATAIKTDFIPNP